MSTIYNSLISQNISINFFDTIINLQKNEFNYTISYYYHYLLNLVNSIDSFIINNIPTNEMMTNNIIDLRKQEINNELNKIIQKINDSKNEVLNINNQQNFLKVNKYHFFMVNSIFINNYEKNVKSLEKKIRQIYDYCHDNYELNDKYIITIRYYFENSEFCKQINSFYEEIFDIELNKEKFKELINNNWIIDPDDIINRLNISLFNSNQEIYKHLLVIIDNYTLEMEKEINKYFTKEIMIERINESYKKGIKRFDNYKKSDFKKNLYEILNLISENFYNESVRVNNTAVLYNSDFSKINDTVKNYKEKIFNETKRIYTNVIMGFRDNVMNNIYKKYIEIGLDEYITECKKYTKGFKEYYLLNSSYNLEEITNNIIEELINDYKQFIIKLIDYKDEKELKNIFDLDELEELINYELDYKYNLFLLPILKKKAIYENDYTIYTAYDFNENIKKTLDSKINTNINKISDIFLSLKGDNYQVNISNWEKLVFSSINSKLSYIKTNFEKFIESEKANEKNLISNSIKNIIKSNYNILFNNILSSFGKEYFERAIKFNEYFRIKDLYNNLKYSFVQTLLYYLTIKKVNTIYALPKELKNIYNLNNIDFLILNIKFTLLELLNNKIKEVINDSKNYLITNYLSYIEDDIFITLSFSQSIREMINNNLNIIVSDIEKDYENILSEYLNDNFIDPYSKIINEETNELINFIKWVRYDINNDYDNLFTLEPDIVLNNILLQINATLDLINEYNSNYNTYKIPNDLIHFSNNYGTNNVKPIFDEFKNKIYMVLNNQIISNFENKTKIYENSINLDEYLKNINITFLNLKNNYIDNMTKNINNYYTNYYLNFEKEVIKENNERTDNLDETFEKLLKKYDNSKIIIESLKEFNDYNKKY